MDVCKAGMWDGKTDEKKIGLMNGGVDQAPLMLLRGKVGECGVVGTAGNDS